MPQNLKRFLSNFHVVAIQNSLDGFSNTLNVRMITAKPVAGSLSSRVLLVVTGFWELRRKVFVEPFAFRTLETYFLSSAFESSEDGRQSALLSKVLATDFLWQIGW